MSTLDVSILNGPLRLAPDNFTHQLWGGTWIPQFKNLPLADGLVVGESWEFSARAERPSMIMVENGDRISVLDLINRYPTELLGKNVNFAAPLLIKLIDAHDDLSLQVHPVGKSEAWVILESGNHKDDGFIYLGFNESKAADYASQSEFEEAFFNALNQANAQGPSLSSAVRQKSERLVLPFLNKIKVKPGDVFIVDPGTLHAIGRGVRLFEIQQNSDITYRVWDWNRPDSKKSTKGKLMFRELHLEQAKKTLNFDPQPANYYQRAPQTSQSEEILVIDADKKFAASRILFKDKQATFEVGQSPTFQVLTAVRGSFNIGFEVNQGHSVFLPASMRKTIIRANQLPTEIIRSYVPI